MATMQRSVLFSSLWHDLSHPAQSPCCGGALPAALGTMFACYVFYIQTKGQVRPYIYFPRLVESQVGAYASPESYHSLSSGGRS